MLRHVVVPGRLRRRTRRREEALSCEEVLVSRFQIEGTLRVGRHEEDLRLIFKVDIPGVLIF